MKKYVFKRLCIAVVTVFVILFVLFLMLELMPGSPFNDEKMTGNTENDAEPEIWAG